MSELPEKLTVTLTIEAKNKIIEIDDDNHERKIYEAKLFVNGIETPLKSFDYEKPSDEPRTELLIVY